jgi:hypothetical protein
MSERADKEAKDKFLQGIFAGLQQKVVNIPENPKLFKKA